MISKRVTGLFPDFSCKDPETEKAFRLAAGGIAANIRVIRDGILPAPAPCLMAGLDYSQPWTRDAAINVYFCAAVIDPAVAENTLRCVLREENGRITAGGQYWDRVIWSLGAWRLWKVTGDRDWLVFARDVIRNTLTDCERDEQDPADGLFFGAAVYGDGVSAYPEKYRNPDLTSGIIRWPSLHPEAARPVGGGLPMKTLSLNCVYAETYRVLGEMTAALGEDGSTWLERHDRLCRAINDCFWISEKQTYTYLLGEPYAQESLGLAFVLLFGIAGDERAEAVLRNTYIAPAGIPCVWPPYAPYDSFPGHVGRHSGTVWPHIQGFWALAALRRGRADIFLDEMHLLAAHAVRDMQFAEIYHPEDSRIYGGMQEGAGKMIEWRSCSWQTWSAAAYLAMVQDGLCGLGADGLPEREPLDDERSGPYTLRLSAGGKTPVIIQH